MKICFYALREFDELPFCEEFKKEYGIDYVYTTEYPTPENIALASGCDGVSSTPCDMSVPVLEAFRRVGVRYILCEYASLDKVLAESDVLTLHMNANESNHHIIGRDAIAKMKKGAYLVNTAREKLIDSEALIEGIESGKLGGAALDVVEFENGLYYYNHMGEVMVNPKLALLRSFPNVINSPHTAFYTAEDVREMIRGNFKSLADFESGAKAPGFEEER